MTGSEPVVVSRFDHDQGEVPWAISSLFPAYGELSDPESVLLDHRNTAPSRESLSDRIVLKSVSAETMARPSRAAREDLLVGRCLHPEILHVRNVLSGYGELPGDDR